MLEKTIECSSIVTGEKSGEVVTGWGGLVANASLPGGSGGGGDPDKIYKECVVGVAGDDDGKSIWKMNQKYSSGIIGDLKSNALYLG